MCQRVVGPEVVLKERFAWKLFFLKKDKLRGYLYSRSGSLSSDWPYRRGIWMKSHRKPGGGIRTQSGFHVFATKKAAQKRFDKNRLSSDPVLVKVKIRGKALPFDSGWAVHEMLIPNE